MKNYAFHLILLFLLMGCESDINNTLQKIISKNNNLQIIDTIFSTKIKTTNSDYSIYYIGTHKGQYIKIIRNQNIITIPLPSDQPESRLYLKNFKIDSIVPTTYGFKFYMSYSQDYCRYSETFFIGYNIENKSLNLIGRYIICISRNNKECAEKFVTYDKEILIDSLDWVNIFKSSKDMKHSYTLLHYNNASIQPPDTSLLFNQRNIDKILHRVRGSTCGFSYGVYDCIDTIGNRFLSIIEGDKYIAQIPLPPVNIYSKNYIKNFIVDSIVPTHYGFDLITEFGGGCCSFSDTYFFKFNPQKNNFYLVGFYLEYRENNENEVAQKLYFLKNPIPVQKVNIINYYSPTDTRKDTLHQFKKLFKE